MLFRSATFSNLYAHRGHAVIVALLFCFPFQRAVQAEHGVLTAVHMIWSLTTFLGMLELSMHSALMSLPTLSPVVLCVIIGECFFSCPSLAFLYCFVASRMAICMSHGGLDSSFQFCTCISWLHAVGRGNSMGGAAASSVVPALANMSACSLRDWPQIGRAHV